MKSNRYFLLVAMLMCAIGIMAQRPSKFDPERFETELEQFVATRAGLTPAQSAAFFPVYREMRKRQLANFCMEKRLRHIDTSDDKACAEAIRSRDEGDIELKRMQQAYHERFMTILPASKVYLILRAEDAFHRQLFKHAGNMRKK